MFVSKISIFLSLSRTMDKKALFPQVEDVLSNSCSSFQILRLTNRILRAMTEWNKNVKFVRLLNAHHDSKTAVVEGEAEDKDGVKQPAVLFFEKAPFEYDELSKMMQESGEQFKLDFVNDIYHKYVVEAREHCNGKSTMGREIQDENINFHLRY